MARRIGQVWAAISPTSSRDVIRGMSSDASLEVRTGVCETMNNSLRNLGSSREAT